MDFNNCPTPYYIVYEDKLRRNLDIIKNIAKTAGVEIIMAFKANALWRTFSIMREYGVSSTASSINEMILGNEELGKLVHTYCPAYTDNTIDKYISGSSHITFNSISQFKKYITRLKSHNSISGNHYVSAGLRINPECSIIETDIYNPCIKGSRFGVLSEDMPEILPEGIEGFHFHALCESSSFDLEKVLLEVEHKFGKYLNQLKWINMGGGHLMTKKDYNTSHLINLLNSFKQKHPNLSVILEPGSAFTWQTGDLVSSVIDIVVNGGVSTAIIDSSFACHMPDCLEMPYQPVIESALDKTDYTKPTYRMGGNSCLSGDFCGDWSFEKPLKPSDKIVFKDMNHYTTVKTNMFNGIQHPSIYFCSKNNEISLLREFSYLDYKNRMD
ncbi:MAG: carboxynorspermidine decarboxylase [Muribaculaceae bacterium]|nr:carboxynorspermidine decarboxylase [Muribaculaceae bacterium]